MKRSLRFLLIGAPLIVLLLGVPAGVALARRSPPSVPALVSPGGSPSAIVNGTVRPGANGSGSFIGPRPYIGPPLPGSQVSQAQSGIAGTVTRVSARRFVVYTRAKKVAVVVIDPKTTIRMNGKTIKASDVKRGDHVTILGRRDSAGTFHAALIRVVRPARPDPPPGGAR
ncbi:MAG: hypothetical protein ACYDAR_07385 [Thermomicrobiales bacterium]